MQQHGRRKGPRNGSTKMDLAILKWDIDIDGTYHMIFDCSWKYDQCGFVQEHEDNQNHGQ